MTQKSDWDAIRVRYARGETAYAISKSMGGKPTRQGIMKRAKRESWMQGNSTIPESIKNLSLLQVHNKHPRKRTPENVNAILGFMQNGASDEIAAKAAGISPKTLYTWKSDDPEFAAMIEVARAQKVVEWIGKIDSAKDWKAQLKLLQVAPETNEQFADRRKDEGPTIILNIHRDEVVIDQVAQPTTAAKPNLESIAHQESVEELQSTAEPVEESANWQGDDIIEKKEVSEQRALEQRVMGSKKTH